MPLADPRDALIAEFHRHWGLDESLPQQYWLFMRRLAHGDLGTSFFYRTDVRTLVVSESVLCATRNSQGRSGGISVARLRA